MERIIDTFTSRTGKAEVAVLMPVYNEAEIIENVILEYFNVIGTKIPVEIVISEDGSTDGTKEVIRSLAEKIPLKALLSTMRKGYSKGIIDGLDLVKSNYVLITDSDGQHDPKDFWKLWNLRDKYDIISGYRVNRADAFHRKVMSKTFQVIAKKFFNLPKFKDITAPFKLMKTNVAREIASEWKYMKESFWTEFTIRAHRKGYKITEVPVNHRMRTDGGTRVYKFSKIPKIVYFQTLALIKLKGELFEAF